MNIMVKFGDDWYTIVARKSFTNRQTSADDTNNLLDEV